MLSNIILIYILFNSKFLWMRHCKVYITATVGSVCNDIVDEWRLE